MNNIDSLYRQVIMEHYKNPRNKGLVDDESYHTLHLKNPSCGDDITMEALVEDGVVKEIRHQGSGCSICCSSASVLSETLKGKKVDEAKELIKDFYGMITGEREENEDLEEALVYQGVSKFPARIKCATLSWKAIEEAINKNEE